MPQPTETRPHGLLQAAYTVALVVLWLVWLLFQLLKEVLHALTWRRARRGLGLIALGLLAWAAWLGVPLLWGRARLEHAAAQVARGSHGIAAHELGLKLQREAFAAGLRSPLPGPEAFSVEQRWEDGMSFCRVTFAFPQDIPLPLGRTLRVTIRGRAEAAVDEERAKPRTIDDLVQ